RRLLFVQFRITPKDALLVEGNAAVGREISPNVRPRGDAVAQSDQARNLALERLHSLREGIAKAIDDLEQRQIDVGDPSSREIGAAIVLQQLLEIAEIFRHTFLPE